MSQQFLVISGGELWLHEADGQSTQIVSPFAKEMLQREADRQRTTSWKYAEREDSKGLIGPALWGRGGGGADNLAPARFLHVCKAGEPRTIYYVMTVGRTVGLLVDAVSDILQMAEASVQPTPDVASEHVKSFVKGIFSIDGRMISLIDLNHVLPEREAQAA